MTNIAVIGAGAVGTSIAMFIQPTTSVTLLGRKQEMRSYDDRETQSQTSIDVQPLNTHQDVFDVIFIAVKTHQLAAVIPHLRRITHANTRIILAQNGYASWIY